MVKAYPHFRSSYSHEEMVEHFLLTPAELQLVLTCRGDANRCGMALLLKTISHLGYVPDPMPQIPEEVRAFVAAQLVFFEFQHNGAEPKEDYGVNCSSASSAKSPGVTNVSCCFQGKIANNSRMRRPLWPRASGEGSAPASSPKPCLSNESVAGA